MEASMFQTSPFYKRLLAVITVTRGYLLFGTISMLAAIPPGYATAVWPAAGVALLAALLLGRTAYIGVFLGAGLLNYGISANYNNTDPSILLSACMGAFATLQAFVGRYLICAVVQGPVSFSRTSTVAKFIVLGGIISPLFNSTISNIFLWSQGVLPDGDWFKNWVSWYMGDAIGIIFIVPWLLVFLPETLSARVSKARFMLYSLLSVTLGSALLGYLVTNTEKQKHSVEFGVNANVLERSLSGQIDRVSDILQAMAGFVRIQEQVTPGEFRVFVTELLERNTAIHGLSWNERLTGEALAGYESMMRNEYAAFDPGIQFSVKRLDAPGSGGPAGDTTHVVVSYIEPVSDNVKALGLDVYSSDSRREALDAAWRTGSLYPTVPINLVQGEHSEPGVLLFLPASEIVQSTHSGYSTAVLKAQSMISAAFEDALLEHGAVLVFDPDVKEGNATLFSHLLTEEESNSLIAGWPSLRDGSEDQFSDKYALLEKREIKVGARHWILLQLSESQFLYQPWGVHLLLAGTVLFAGLLGWFIIIMAGHTDEIEFQVERRTFDLTEANKRLRDSEVAQAEAVREAQRSNQAKSDFLANMSHEIRTPLNAILGLSRLGLAQQPPATYGDKFAKINHSGELLLAIINDILDFSKIEAQKLQLEKRIFSLKDIVSQLRDLFAEQAESKGIALSFRFEGKMTPWLRGDSLRLRQVLVNLLSNAVKFTGKGSVTMVCRSEVISESATRLIISVTDTGIGMSEAQQNVIFDAFTQADSSTSRKYGGTGLGMTISHRLVSAMEGEIAVESELDKGTCFTVSLPFDVPSELEIAEFRKQTRSLSAVPSSVNSGHILLVEDNEINQEVVGEQLRQLGMQVSFADNGALAVSAVRENVYDLILMDIQMPVMDGYEATRHIRAAGITTPIVALTAAAMVEDMRKALACGMNDHLSKPFRQEDMIRVLKQWITPTEN